MEAVKNRLTRVWRNAWSFVIDANPDFVANMGDSDLDQSTGRREAYGIVDDRVDCSGKAVGFAHHHGAILARASEREASVADFASLFPAVHQLLDQIAQIDWLEGSASKLGISPGSLPNIADQAIEAGYIL